MNNRILGALAMIFSPFLAIELIMDNQTRVYNHSTVGAVLSLFYLLGWASSIVGIYQLSDIRKSLFLKIVLILQLFLIVLAFCWSFFDLINPNSNNVFYKVLDICWPLSNLFMLIVGVIFIFKKLLNGYYRFTPLFVGLWLPLCIVLGRDNNYALYICAAYSAIAWFMLGKTVYTNCDATQILV